MRVVVGLLLASALLTNEFAVAGDIGLEAQWLWSSRFPRASETIRLRREFTVNGAVHRAELRGLADDHAQVGFLLVFFAKVGEPPFIGYSDPLAVADVRMECRREADGHWRISLFDSGQIFRKG